MLNTTEIMTDKAQVVAERLRALKEANRVLAFALNNDQTNVTPPLRFTLVWGESTPFSAHVSDLLSLGFDDSSGSVTRNPYGIVVVSPNCINLALAVNEAKDQFATACRTLVKGQVYRTGRELISKIAQSEQVYTLSLRQAYRHLLVSEHPISRIGFSFARKGRSIKVISHDDASKRLIEQLGEEHTDLAIRTVQHFVSAKAPLYLVWNNPERLIANITYADMSQKALGAHSLILTPQGTTPVSCNIASDQDWNILAGARIRAPRHDRKISEIPILPHTHIHPTIEYEHLCQTQPGAGL